MTIRINNFYINKEDSKIKNIKNHFNFVAISMYLPIFLLILLILFFILKYDEITWGSYAKNPLITLLYLSSFLLFSLTYYFKNKKTKKIYDDYKFKNKFSITNYKEILPPLILHSVYSIPILFLTSSTWFSHERNLLYVIITPFIFLTLNIFLANFVLFKEKTERNNARNIHFFFIIPILILFICLVALFALSENLPRSMFNKIHLVETPKNSQWYAINYKNSIIPEKHLKKAKEKFICTPSEFFSCNTLPNTHPDFFFGYMAWNLGEKKIFCPYSAQFGSDKAENKAFSKMCIIINSDAITPWNEQYIHTPHSPESWL